MCGRIMANQIAISLCYVTKRFGDVMVVNNPNLDIAQGEIFGLLGPKGGYKYKKVYKIGMEQRIAILE
jgi:ABC-type uncharacterized transport system ATPase subunit